MNNIIKTKLKFVASVAELLPYFSLIISVVRNKAPYDIFPNEIVNPNISDSLIVWILQITTNKHIQLYNPNFPNLLYITKVAENEIIRYNRETNKLFILLPCPRQINIGGTFLSRKIITVIGAIYRTIKKNVTFF